MIPQTGLRAPLFPVTLSLGGDPQTVLKPLITQTLIRSPELGTAALTESLSEEWAHGICNSAASSLSLIQIARFQTKLVTCCILWGLTRKTLVSVIATAYTGNKGEAT